ncbi:MAG: hypothetical protein NPIRA04_35100 [Nitrospirales bacterium]|nr:MAG: hypothetical protein NPIRA04_35100 [Nitrospirales bacterium]
MKILLAVDQSRNSLAAAHWLQGLHIPASSVVYLLDIVEIKQWPEWSTLDDARQFCDKIDAVREKVTTKARRFISRLAESLSRPRVEVRTDVVEGIPGAEILTAIDQHQIDLVVVGAKGLSGIKRFLLGSVSEWILSDAPCSVLVVRGEPRWTRRKARNMRVLFATDGSQDSQKAIALLKGLNLPKSTHLHILHVLETSDSLTRMAGGITGHMRASQLTAAIKETDEQIGKKLLQETRRSLGRRKFRMEAVVTEGHAADEILKAIKRTRADLVVVGSRGLTGLRRFLLGSVAHKVARNSSSSVLVVR